MLCINIRKAVREGKMCLLLKRDNLFTSIMSDRFERRKRNCCAEAEKSVVCYTVNAAAISDIGCTRLNNEDNYILGKKMNVQAHDYSEDSVRYSEMKDKCYLFGVFDGMGGGELGEVASRITAECFQNRFDDLSDCKTREEANITIRNLFQESNNQIVCSQREHAVLGTTGTVLLLRNGAFKIFHVGDSRAYVMRAGNLFQITKDQTLAQIKKEMGLYMENDPSEVIDKHRLTEYIGKDHTLQNLKSMESEWIPAVNRDVILLCSDGLYDMCSDEEISYIIRKNNLPDRMAQDLVDCAKNHGGEDNITCVIISFSE